MHVYFWVLYFTDLKDQIVQTKHFVQYWLTSWHLICRISLKIRRIRSKCFTVIKTLCYLNCGIRMVYISLIFCTFEMFFRASLADLNSTYSTDNSTYRTGEQSTMTTTTTEKTDKLFGNPFWVGFTVIFFISLVIITLAISLTFGLYKFRKEARKRGHYKRKAQVYGAPEDKSEVDYEIFTTCQDSAETERNEESNATYLGAT